MERMKQTAPAEAVGCIIGGGQEAKTESPASQLACGIGMCSGLTVDCGGWNESAAEWQARLRAGD